MIDWYSIQQKNSLLNQIHSVKIPKRFSKKVKSYNCSSGEIELMHSILKIELFNRPYLLRQFEFFFGLTDFFISTLINREYKNYTLGHFQIGVITSLKWTNTPINTKNYLTRLLKLMSLKFGIGIFQIGLKKFENQYYSVEGNFSYNFSTFYNGKQVSNKSYLSYNEVLESLLNSPKFSSESIISPSIRSISDKVRASDYVDRFENLKTNIIDSKTLELIIIVYDKFLNKPIYSAYHGNFKTSRQVVSIRRSIASTIKMAIYSCYIEMFKSDINETLIDEPISVELNGSIVNLRNSDNKFRGEVSLEYAFANSINTIAVQLLLKIGIKNFVTYLRQFDIYIPLPNTPIISLGAFKLNGFELLNLMSPIIYNGYIVKHSYSGFYSRTTCSKILSEPTVHKMKHLLHATTKYGTAKYLSDSGLKQQGGKTGTSENNRDFWYLGYIDSRYYGLVWIGDQNEMISKDDIPLSATRIAVPIWKDISMSILKG